MNKRLIFTSSAMLAFLAVAVTSPVSGIAQAEQAVLVAGSHFHDSSEAATESAAGAQRFCPITGNPIDRTSFLDHKGKRIYFCCNACKSAFEKAPDEHIRALESKGVILEKAP